MTETIYTKNAETNQLIVERKFNGPIDLVWSAWTKPELLDQWWAPHPFFTETKTLMFEVGGHWLYTMNGPEGLVHWCRADYTAISPKVFFDLISGFCDEEGAPSAEILPTEWHVVFQAEGDQTLVKVDIQFPSAETMQQHIEMGFKEGFAAAHQNLDQLLTNL